MGKNKFKRFQENLTFKCLVQPEFDDIFHKDHTLKGRWRDQFFENQNPITLELGCGRGEYTVELAQESQTKNFIGVDIKGARMWRGAKTVTDNGMNNAGFLRTRIEFIDSFFASQEVNEIWITFPDPQLKKGRAKKRLTSAGFLNMYKKFLAYDGVIRLKTDSLHLHEYTLAVLKENGIEPIECNGDIYGSGFADAQLSIKTTYEARYLKEGLPITYVAFQLPEKELVEPIFQPDEEERNLDLERVKGV